MLNYCTISSIKPTIYFIKDGGELKQLVEIAMTVPHSAELSVRVNFSGREVEIPLGKSAAGDVVHRAAIPDIRDEIPVRFALYADGLPQDEKEIVWKPGKHWEVYLVQVSHHDLGYTDLPTHVLEEHCDFFDDVLRFCRETDHYPDDAKFRYTIEQAWSILYYLENRPPEVVDEMIERIKEGRVEVTALIGNQITEIHGPEELVRALYPAFRLKREFGIPITTAELNDVPGLSWGLSLALAEAGIRYFAPALPTYFQWGYTVHNFWDEKAVLPRGGPDAFWWESPDGQRVLFWYNEEGASGATDPLLSNLPAWLERAESIGYPYDILRYWVMGGHRDNAPPIIDFAHTVRAWNEKWAYPHLILGTGALFFEHLSKLISPDLRAYRGELPGTDYPIGALCTGRETALNRNNHDALLTAERLATIASVVSDYQYPAEKLSEAYEATLLYDEHIWGQADPGGHPQAAEWAFKAELAYRPAAIAHDLRVKALNKIADCIKTEAEEYHIVVFNPLPNSRTDVVTVELRSTHPCSSPMARAPRTDGRDGPGIFYSHSAIGRPIFDLPLELKDGEFDLIDASSGRNIPYQIIRMSGPQDCTPDAPHRWALAHVDERRFYSLRFLADDIPALGYRTYRIVPRKGKHDLPAGVHVGETEIENRFYRVILDPMTGAITSIFDKELGRELIDPHAAHKLNQLIVRSAQTHQEYQLTDVTISKGTSGPISGSLVVKSSITGCPQVTQEITLYADLKRIDLATRLLKDSTPLREVFIAFPFHVDNPQFKYESALSIMSPLEDQFPGSNTDYYAVQHWVNVYDGTYSITWCSPDAAVTEFGGLWQGYVSQAHHGVPTPGFGHEFLKPGQLTRSHLYSYVLNNNFRTNFQPVQTGEVLLRYSIGSWEGDWREGRARDFGWCTCLPLETVCIKGGSPGTLPSVQSFCRIENPNVILLALKRAEDEDGFIVRLWEMEGMDTVASVELPFISIGEVWATNAVEENLHPIPASGNFIEVPLKAFGIATVRIRPDKGTVVKE